MFPIYAFLPPAARGYTLEQLITTVTAAFCYSEAWQTDGEPVMKPYSKAVPVFLLLVFGAVASAPAMAQRYGYGHGHGYGGGVRFGITLGLPLYGTGYYPGYYNSYPAYVYPGPGYVYPGPAYTYPGPAYAYPGPAVAPSATYVEQGAPQPQAAPAQAQPQPQGDWYYCTESKTYYPYVRECPGGWLRVPSTPPSR